MVLDCLGEIWTKDDELGISVLIIVSVFGEDRKIVFLGSQMVMDLIVESCVYDEESGISVSIIEKILCAQQLAGAEHAEE